MKKNWKTFKATSKNLAERLNNLTEVWRNFHVNCILPGPVPGTYLIVLHRTNVGKTNISTIKFNEPSSRNIAT